MPLVRVFGAARFEAAPGCKLDHCYHTYPLPKKAGGKRRITVPPVWLRSVQRQIYKALLLPLGHHEAAHGFAARALGDPTAEALGRISLNPLRHIDPFGTILLPGFLIVMGAGFLFGYAKPVPVDLRYFRNPRRDMVIVEAIYASAAAGGKRIEIKV